MTELPFFYPLTSILLDLTNVCECVPDCTVSSKMFSLGEANLIWRMERYPIKRPWEMDQITIGWQLLGPFGRTYIVSPPSICLPLSCSSGLSHLRVTDSVVVMELRSAVVPLAWFSGALQDKIVPWLCATRHRSEPKPLCAVPALSWLTSYPAYLRD